MQISVVIPTCNRKTRVLHLLEDLNRSVYPIAEVIIVDSGDEPLVRSEYARFSNLNVINLVSERGVCIQRNIGIKTATAPWIFICDDDIEVPDDYLKTLTGHIEKHPEAGAVSGLFLQKEAGNWTGSYDITSAKELFFKYIFQLSIWGTINCTASNIIIKNIKAYYAQKGNYISIAGWPVITKLSGDFFITPAYTLGASLVRKSWLNISPFDEVLDRHGIGENYGVAAGFPATGIHVLNNAFVYHHQEPVNRLKKPLQYYRRALALDYFIKTKKIAHVRKRYFLWSLFGNWILYILTGNSLMIVPAFKTLWRTAVGSNPYYEGARHNQKVVEPLL